MFLFPRSFNPRKWLGVRCRGQVFTCGQIGSQHRYQLHLHLMHCMCTVTLCTNYVRICHACEGMRTLSRMRLLNTTSRRCVPRPQGGTAVPSSPCLAKSQDGVTKCLDRLEILCISMPTTFPKYFELGSAFHVNAEDSAGVRAVRESSD